MSDPLLFEIDFVRKMAPLCTTLNFILRYPKSQIDICIQILEEGDSEYVTLATILTACGVAIGDAGLEMFGLVVAAANEKTFVALMPELNQVTGLITEEENVKPIILEAKAIYPHVHQHFVN